MNSIPVNKLMKKIDEHLSWSPMEIKALLFELSMDNITIGGPEIAPWTRKPRGYAEPIDYSKPAAAPVSDVPE